MSGSEERDLRDDVTALRMLLTETTAERDQLQARIDAYEGHLEAWEEMAELISQSSLGTPEAAAIRERTPPGVGRAIVRAAEYLARAEEAEAERDRLRTLVHAALAGLGRMNWAATTRGDHEVVEATAKLRDLIEAQLEKLDGAGESTVEIGGQVMTEAQYDAARFPLTNEWDRLRAVVDVARHLVRTNTTTDGEETQVAKIDHWAFKALVAALDALDISADIGGEGTT